MKIVHIVTASLIFSACASFAQERTHDETSLILSSRNFVNYENPDVDCDWAAPFLPRAVRGGWVSELYPLQTEESSGEVVGEGEQIGELWTCFDEAQDIIDPATGPGFEQDVAFAIIIDEEVFGALGTVRQRGYIPRDQVNLYAITASVSRVVDGVVGEFVGSMTSNIAFDFDELYGGSNEIVTLRLFTPRDYEREALEDAFRRAFGGASE